MLFSKKFLVVICLLMCDFYTQAQHPDQTIRGKIVEKSSLAPVSNANVILVDTDPLIGTITDSTGNFKIKNVKPGRYDLKVTSIGYHQQTIYNLLLNSGKEMVLEIALSEKVNNIDEVTISADKLSGNDPLNINYLSSRMITAEEAERYPATYSDPARLITSGPGISITNDEANHLIVRGNSPNSISWRIEDAEIVNPNHLINAGTFTDKPSLTGGGVAILSTKLLGNSRFLSGAFPAGFGNALAGIFDIHLRKGNNEEHEFTGQAGLLGIDITAEGPMSKKYKGSFLVNYRYSTIGLFSLMGIPIGDEQINFQDLSFNISLPAGKTGEFKIFGFGGASITRFTGKRDSLQWNSDKDRSDVDFYSDVSAAGLVYKVSTGNNDGIHSVLAISQLKSGRKESFISGNYDLFPVENDELFKQIISFSTYYYKKINASHLIKAGIMVNRNLLGIKSSKAFILNEGLKTLHNRSARFLLYQPYISWQYKVSPKIQLNTGLHYMYSDFNHSHSPEPRLSLKWNLNSTSYLSAGYGLHSQIQHPAIYFSTINMNNDSGLSKAHHFVAGFTKWINKKIIFRSEVYHQSLFNIPVSKDSTSSFSALNIIETSVKEELVNNGTGKNYGVDLSLQRLLNKGYYFLFSGSLYNSLYTAADGIERNTRFNGNYMISLTAGKEFNLIKNEKVNIFGINIRANRSGGLRYTPIDEKASQSAGEVVYDKQNAFSEQLDDFMRIDLSFTWRKNKPDYTRTLAFEIQNITNRKNPAYHYYDLQQEKVITRNQLGLIPFISYRVSF